MTVVADKPKAKRLNPQRRKAAAIAKQIDENLALLPEILVYPNQLQIGDILSTGEDRSGNPYWNSDAKAIEEGTLDTAPRGCRGKTHVGRTSSSKQDCYDNISPVWVKRRS